MTNFKSGVILYILLFTLPVLTKAQSTSLAPVKDPCEVLTKDFIESIDGFKKASEGRPNLAGSDTWRICDLLVDNRTMGVSMKRYNDRIIETKGVERTYKTILAMDDQLTRTNIENPPGDQAIYTFGRTNLPGKPYTYELQWRYGNHTEGMVVMKYTKKQDSDDMLNRLTQIAQKLGE